MSSVHTFELRYIDTKTPQKPTLLLREATLEALQTPESVYVLCATCT